MVLSCPRAMVLLVCAPHQAEGGATVGRTAAALEGEVRQADGQGGGDDCVAACVRCEVHSVKVICRMCGMAAAGEPPPLT